MKTINFTINNVSGTATVCDSYVDGANLASNAFCQSVTDNLSIRQIGEVTPPLTEGENWQPTYRVYECYTDAGSDDYVYFAIEKQ